MAKSKSSKSKKEDDSENYEEALLRNFVNLQKVLTNLSIKFEELSSNISKLLQLFELSAKSFSEGNLGKSGIDQEFLKKLDSLLEQNKTISKGIMLMEDRIRNRAQPTMRPTIGYPEMQRPKQLPRF